MKINKQHIAAILALISSLNMATAEAEAEAIPSDSTFDSATVYGGQGANHNLLQLPGRIIKADLDWEKSYFTAICLGKTRGTLGRSFDIFRDTMFESIRHGPEIVLVKHHGLQSNAEIGAANMWRTTDLQLGELGVNFAAGAGLSYALGTPTYEDGPENDPARRYRLQFLALFEFEWSLRGSNELSLVTRVHHRSGVYGLIAPRHVGSNFLAVGMRYKF